MFALKVSQRTGEDWRGRTGGILSMISKFPTAWEGSRTVSRKTVNELLRERGTFREVDFWDGVGTVHGVSPFFQL